MSRKKGFEANPLVGVIMGSDSDLETMLHSATILKDFEVPHEVRVISAHRTPDAMSRYGKQAVRRGLQVIIAGAGGSAHLPGGVAPHTRIPVLGVALGKTDRDIEDAIGSIYNMPKGVPVPLMGINEKGAVNGAWESVRILGLQNEEYASAYEERVISMGGAVMDIDDELRVKGPEVYLRDRRMAETDRQHG